MSQLSRYPSPLRYPGGKGKIANYIKVLMIENGLLGRDYVEPYAGGSSVALSLLFEDFAEHAHINDLNLGIFYFWKSATEETEALCGLITDTNVSIEEWHKQRAVLESQDSTPLEVAFATFFLNRTNRSGIISGGVIGGLDQSGPWKIDARFNKESLIQRIQKVGRYRNRITVSNLDAVEFVQQWNSAASDSAFLYLDPPYYEKGEGLYDNFYAASDHAGIAEAVRDLAHPWIVSYDAHPDIIKLYPDAQQIRYRLSYSANHAKSLGSEVMFFSDEIAVPELAPSGVGMPRVAQAQRDRMAGH